MHYMRYIKYKHSIIRAYKKKISYRPTDIELITLLFRVSWLTWLSRNSKATQITMQTSPDRNQKTVTVKCFCFPTRKCWALRDYLSSHGDTVPEYYLQTQQ